MIRAGVALLLLFAQVPGASASPVEMNQPLPFDSLFLAPDEVQALEMLGSGQGVAAFVLPGTAAAPAPRPNLHLSAILYTGPQSWSIWINGMRLEPGAQLPGVVVRQVAADHVELLVGNHPRLVRLRPNQTYVTAAGMTVEGLAQ